MRFACIILLCSVILGLPKHKAADPIPSAAKKLVEAYPDFIIGFADNQLLFKDNTRLLWDDGIKNKTFKQLLEQPDIEDMFAQEYTGGAMPAPPAKNFDPGRIRNEAFFLKMYGATKQDVNKKLVQIMWCPKLVGQKISVTQVNGVDKQLLKISAELDQHPELKKYLTDIGGTFNWRNIAGTGRHSMHSFGMTMDVNTNYSDYWQWHCKCKTEETAVKYVNRIPQIIVDTFEKYGFIWGGKWYHYDTMHFEYRPELINH
jgi:hypothetical protein